MHSEKTKRTAFWKQIWITALSAGLLALTSCATTPYPPEMERPLPTAGLGIRAEGRFTYLAEEKATLFPDPDPADGSVVIRAAYYRYRLGWGGLEETFRNGWREIVSENRLVWGPNGTPIVFSTHMNYWIGFRDEQVLSWDPMPKGVTLEPIKYKELIEDRKLPFILTSGILNAHI